MIAFARAMLVVATLAAPPNAPAPDPKRAATSFAIGKSAYARGDFSAAGAAFEQAALYAPHPATSLNAAEAWELAGELVRSAEILEKVLKTPELEQRYHDAADEQLQRVSAKLGRLEVQIPASVKVTVDGDRGEGFVPGVNKLYVMPGNHVIAVKGPRGENRTDNVKIGAGETRSFEVLPFDEPPEPAPVDHPPPPKKESEKHGPPVLSWVAFGVGAAGASVATVYGIKTVQAKNDFDARPTLDTRDNFDSSRLVTNVSLGVAAVAVIVGVVLWMTDR